MITHSCVESAKALGMPEGAIPLANATAMLATAPKSNAAYTAYAAAEEDVKAGLGIEIPKSLRPPFFEGYKYPHDFENNYVKQQYLPSDIANRKYFQFGSSKAERAAELYSNLIKGKNN